ncbi:MAG: acetyl-CoA carboxylase biotin carboxyl carrier protein [Rhodospirillaceae bacterium]|jgi:acetyl-CoA carboxylase biotin carboxyl carrier protein|nr:acetyl-CoA carboxylase biotin carboxyl carrier protein [Rhodospirillaceae bacterium]MBT3490696.1 acetyl-CoA carboxylase biotin carboxyl carrier protein [Rhodospirillaceae bacterium]MBT3978483.1 acetyl-CoA carboxylase biotin carboxyl carrier protein [Rhodospirillaceae bacterium]MBT4564049.1 acetyl-CoA carboxylase biotin carboxyl carrier protein [Rhodospirillaceae bacterium]MBT4746251.1 acetyl-CoA carboxylase biotin carboxyl carrier protein [Rhodospirillaceae bacterium]
MTKTEVDKDLIRELAALMEETGLSEIEIENDDDRMRLVRAGTAPAATVAIPAAAAAAAAPTPAAAAAPAAGEGDLSGHPGAVVSPIVGTAYNAPSPDDAPFVQIGDKVTAGQTILVIEAMKTFNEIPSPHGGTVRQILFENASPIEYGDVLMIID